MVNRAPAVPYINLAFICQPQSGWLFELYRKPPSEMGAISLLPISDAHPRGTARSYRDSGSVIKVVFPFQDLLLTSAGQQKSMPAAPLEPAVRIAVSVE